MDRARGTRPAHGSLSTRQSTGRFRALRKSGSRSRFTQHFRERAVVAEMLEFTWSIDSS